MDNKKETTTPNVGSENTTNTNVGSEKKGSIKNSQLATINESLAKMTALVSTITSAGIEEVTDKDGKVTGIMKEYQFFAPVGNRSTLKTFDADIIASTERIAAAQKGRQILHFVICKEMSKLNDKDKLASMGFGSIADYGLALFGFKKQTSNQYARIGKIFINDNYQIDSKILPSSLRVGHFIEMLSYVGEDNDISAIENAYQNGDLTDGLTTLKLRNTLKTIFKAIESTAVDTTGTAETTGTPETAETTGTPETTGATGTAETTDSDTKADSPADRLRKDTAKVFSATIFLREFVASHFSDDTEFSEGVNKVLVVLEEATKALLTDKTE